MMQSVEALVARADKLKARNAVLRSVPGSGYHDDDRDFRGQFMAPHRRHLPGGQDYGAPPLPPIDDHVVAFYGERQIVFAGDDAARVIKALEDWHRAHLTSEVGRLMSYTGTQRKLLMFIPTLALEDGVLAIWRDTWNDVLHALDVQGVGTTGAPLAPDGTTP